MTDINKGIIQSDSGTIKVGGSLAVGDQAIAYSFVNEAKTSLQERGFKEIADQLDLLLRTISENAHAVGNREDLYRHTREVIKELSQEKPNKSAVISILGRLASAAKPVLAIIGIVEGLKSIIDSLF